MRAGNELGESRERTGERTGNELGSEPGFSIRPKENKCRVGGRGHKPRNRPRFAGRFLRLCPRPHLLRLRPRPERRRSRAAPLNAKTHGTRLQRRKSTAGACNRVQWVAVTDPSGLPLVVLRDRYAGWHTLAAAEARHTLRRAGASPRARPRG